jgi:putative methylase
MKLRQLEMILERIRGFDLPSVESEQYQTPAPLAARLLHTAMLSGDITGKCILDLGSGAGILAIGAALLGASVIAVEEDPVAIRIAEENASDLGCDIRFIMADITDDKNFTLIPDADTVIMNPPFGAQKEHADRPFIDLSLKKAETTYGIFNSGSGPFITEYIKGRGSIVASITAGLVIPRTFWFHTQDRKEIPVEIHVIKKL